MTDAETRVLKQVRSVARAIFTKTANSYVTRKRRFRWIGLCFVLLGIGAFYLGGKLNNPQGGENPWCSNLEEATIPNGSGMSILMYTTVCTTLGTDIGSYVHIVRDGQSPSHESLAFSFAPSFDMPALDLEWASPTSARISVDHVRWISKQKQLVNDVKISYAIRKVD